MSRCGLPGPWLSLRGATDSNASFAALSLGAVPIACPRVSVTAEIARATSTRGTTSSRSLHDSNHQEVACKNSCR